MTALHTHCIRQELVKAFNAEFMEHMRKSERQSK